MVTGLPFTETAEPLGGTRTDGTALFRAMCARVRPRAPRTGATRTGTCFLAAHPASSVAWATNRVASRSAAAPSPPKKGRYTRGWVRRVEPDPEPLTPPAPNPPLITRPG